MDNAPKPPTWATTLLVWDRLLDEAGRCHRALRDELLCRFVTPEQRDALTQRAYLHDAARYSAGSATFEAGLTLWERNALDQMALPAGARILLGGAGGGRELHALCKLGYEVSAFEPVAALVQAARAQASQQGQHLFQASYADMVDGLAGHGPLAQLEGPFDAIIFGWVSFSHVTNPRQQRAVLRAARALGPSAPLLLSFMPAHRSERHRALRGLRRGLDNIKRAPACGGELQFMPHCGFTVGFTQEALAHLAKQAGYEMAYYEAIPTAHALLRPRRVPAPK